MGFAVPINTVKSVITQLITKGKVVHGYIGVRMFTVGVDELAAYTVVEFTDSRPESMIQDDTLVLPEHRGRRLGMLVKSRLLETLTSVRPQARRIHTWNAEENAHMLAINVALGYRPASVSAQWQLRLTHS